MREASPTPADLRLLAIPGDISDETFAETLVATAAAELGGRVDYLVSCAGVLGSATRSHETSVGEFDRINGVNYRGSWLVSRAVLRRMVGQEWVVEGGEHERVGQRGSVVHIASQLGLVGRPEAGEFILFVTGCLERHLISLDAQRIL